jgi:hypothetical protein
MLDLELLSSILEEVPVVWGSNSVHEFSLLTFNLLSLFVFFSFFAKKLLLVHDSFSMVVLNNLLDLGGFSTFISLEEDVIFDVLQDHIVDVLQVLGRLKPLLLISFIKVAIPYPVSSIDLPLLIFFLLCKLRL